MRVRLVGWTHFEPPDDVDWSTDADGGQALAEFAGRACYQSWAKPNPATATNAGYLRHILDVGHLSVLEHGTVSFYITGVSRSLTHELIRHRHFSYSQLSQRYVRADGSVVTPDVIATDPAASGIFNAAVEHAERAYHDLVDRLYERLYGRPSGRHQATAYLPDGSPDGETCRECGGPWPCRPARTAVRKLARQAARSVLPNAAETRIVVTGNYRAWRHFIGMRATEHADVEIRALAVECLRHLAGVAPAVFGDMCIVTLADGTEVAQSMLQSGGGG
jgi:thymidylate synthase (FAD)